MTCGVYEIVNKETNQSYIGRSINIESRFSGHLSYPSNNMVPTIELYKKNPEMVELNIIVKIDEHYFDKEELKFITSVCELYEINQRGGWESDKLLNGKNGDIVACPPSILSKREHLPDCVDVEDILYGIEKWAYDVYRYRSETNPSLFANKTKQTDPDSGIYWRKQYFEIKDKCEEYVEKIKELKKMKTPSWIEEQNIRVEGRREMMKIDYKYFKLEKENNILNDKVDELKEQSNFWKTKCLKWRARYHELLEERCRNR